MRYISYLFIILAGLLLFITNIPENQAPGMCCV